MTRPIQYACDPANRFCECGACRVEPAREINLDAVKGLNRSYSATAYFLILLAALCAFYAVAFVRTETIHRDIVFKRSV